MPRQRLELRERMYLGGQWVSGEAGEHPILNPSTEEVIGQVAEASVAQAAAAAAAARRAQPAWAALDPRERAGIFTRITELIGQQADELTELSMLEGGFTRSMASGFAARAIEWFTKAAEATTQDFNIPTNPQPTWKPDGSFEMLNGQIQRRPVGVAAALVPFNGPLFGSAMKSAQALAMGNTVVLKPAPQNPLAVIQLFRIFDQAGLPAGVANLVTSSNPTVGAELTTSQDVDLVTFTGSTAVGKAVYAAGASSMKRLVLELGGKGACLVFADADLDAAVRGIATTWTVNCGQICSAPTRVVVHESRYDELVARLEVAALAVIVGSPFDAQTVAGPVISRAQRARIHALIDTAPREGAKIVTGAPRPTSERGFYVNPTLIAGCTNDMTVAREEIFGPVVCVIPFSTEEQAIAIANDSDYGLSSYLYTQDPARAHRVAGALHAGTIQINTTSMKLDLPRGGVKMSGLGREGGQAGLEEFTELHSVVWS